MLNITLETTNSILDKIQLSEIINENILNKLINSNHLQQISWEAKGFKFDNEKHQLELIQKQLKGNKLHVKYKFAKYGVFPVKGFSLCSLRKPIRHTLAEGNYIDIDIENCHPQLLYQICRANNITVHYLAQYVANRAMILAETQQYYNVSRDEAKTLFIILAYYGSFNNWEANTNNKPPTQFIQNYICELQFIVSKIIDANPN